MMTNNVIGPWIKQFLMDHLMTDRNLSTNTRRSYRDTLVLFLPFSANLAGVSVDRLSTKHITSQTVRRFLQHLEMERRCCVATRNQRLSAIHALARFVGNHSPEHISWCMEICSVPFKKTAKPAMCYLEKDEMDALLSAPDRNSRQGERDYALLLFLYNTGARASEAAGLRISDLVLGKAPAVSISGKGNKVRYCPLWTLTDQILRKQISRRGPDEPVFLNRRMQPLTRFGVHEIVKRYLLKVQEQRQSLRVKRITVHSIRHTTAVHLLRAGVDINTIRAWLGHVSLDTTNIYAEVDLQMKARALAHCEIMTPMIPASDWERNENLIEFLKAL